MKLIFLLELHLGTINVRKRFVLGFLDPLGLSCGVANLYGVLCKYCNNCI